MFRQYNNNNNNIISKYIEGSKRPWQSPHDFRQYWASSQSLQMASNAAGSLQSLADISTQGSVGGAMKWCISKEKVFHYVNIW